MIQKIMTQKIITELLREVQLGFRFLLEGYYGATVC